MIRVGYSSFLADSSGMGEAARRVLTALSLLDDVEVGPAILKGGKRIISDGGWQVPITPALKAFIDYDLSGPADVHMIHCAAMDFDKFRPPFMTAKRIGMTCVEVDRLHRIQIEGCKFVDQVLVPSKHNQEVFERAGIATTVVPYPLVMPPYTDERNIPNRQAIVGVFDSSYVFYCVTTLQERKNIMGLVTAFLHAFTWQDDVALLIKVAGVDPQQAVKDAALFVGALCTDMQIQDPPKIRLLGGEWTDPMLWGLHARGDCYVSLSRGEAFGIPLLDAAAMGNQVIAVPYGGHVDFLPAENTHWVKYRMTPVVQRYPHFNGQQLWADADILQAANLMKEIAKKGRGPKALPNLTAFSTIKIAELLHKVLTE